MSLVYFRRKLDHCGLYVVIICNLKVRMFKFKVSSTCHLVGALFQCVVLLHAVGIHGTFQASASQCPDTSHPNW